MFLHVGYPGYAANGDLEIQIEFVDHCSTLISLTAGAQTDPEDNIYDADVPTTFILSPTFVSNPSGCES